jgi:ligand-binding sensor domain-containing protein/signal transduction histidine kinase
VLGLRHTTLARICATAVVVTGCSAGVRAERVPFRVYNTSHGLAHDRIRCVLADSRGFLWFCTADGLSRFDGSRFVNYGAEDGLPHPEVGAMVETAAGVYWVGTVGGLARLRADSSRSSPPPRNARNAGDAHRQGAASAPFTLYSLGSDASNHVFALQPDRAGRLWIGTAGGLFVLEHPADEPRFRRVDPEPPAMPFGQVRALGEGPDGTLWVGTLAGLFRRRPDGRIVRDRTVVADEEVRRVLVDRLGRFWASNLEGLVVAMPSTSPAASSRWPSSRALPQCRVGSHAYGLPSEPGDACRFDTAAMPGAVVRSLWEGSDGHVWIGTTRGVIEFDGGVRTYSKRHGLSDENVTAVGQDRAGHVWMGTDAGGVARLTRNGVVSFSEADGLSHGYVTWISQGRAGRLRAGGGWPAVDEFDGARFTSGWFRMSRQVDAAGMYDVLEDHSGDLWVGTPSGLLRFPECPSVTRCAGLRPKAAYSIADGLPAARVAPVFEDSRGDIWMTAYLGSDGRVVRWQRSTGRFHQYPETDARLGAVRDQAFAEDASRTVWLGSTRGLARHQNDRFTRIAIRGEHGTTAVTSVHVDPQGRLWVATRGAGLYRSDDATAPRPSFTPYTVAQGLSSGTIWCLTDDGDGNLYAGTARGVDRLDLATGRLRHFSVDDGLAGSEIITAFRDRDGALWFGTFTGISRLAAQPDAARPPPTVWIGDLRIRGATQPVATLGQAQVDMRQLSPDQNHVEIDYFGLSPAPGAALSYQYQLEGTGAGWTPPVAGRSVTYAELAPGSYRFLVRALDEDGHVSQRPASISFTILPPLWQRQWFLAALALTALAAVYVTHHLRVVRLLEMERLRTRIASDLHDDVGSTLTQISILSEIVRTRLEQPGAVITDALARIGTLSRESVDSMSDIVWAIDPARDTPAHLLQRMRRFAYEHVGSAGVQVHFDSSGDASPRLTSDVRRDTFLMFKEILNNVVRHAGATAVHVEVVVAPRQLRVVVTDDGCGFDAAGITDGHGLRSLGRRAAGLDGLMEVASSPGRGTRVTFSVPVR